VYPAEEVIIYVNGSQEMRKGEKAMAGQLWVQGDRMMTASNPAFDDMANTREAAVLSAAAEAIAWRNEALETPGPRKGQRVVIFARDIEHLEEVLISADPNADPRDGHPIAYKRVLEAAAEFEVPPIFLKEDCQVIVTDPAKAAVVPTMVCMAERIATGSRPRVLENGPDTPNSDEEADEDVEADKELNMYAPGVDSTLGPKVLSQAEAARQHAAFQALKAQSSAGSQFTTTDSDMGNSLASSRVPSPQPTRQSTPINSDDEDSGLTEDHRRLKAHARKCSLRNIPRPGNAPGTAPPSKKSQEGVGNSDTRSGAVPEPSPQASEPKKAAAPPPEAPAEQPKGAKAPSPTKEQQVPKHPMETRKGSRAGGFRPGVGGSGQKDTRVASSHPSKT
jgi:hypothetical protein